MECFSEKWFNAKKAAQVAVFFVNKEGKKMNALKLVKLIYLANREHMRQRGYPVFNDNLVSMKYGPVGSLTLNHINGRIESEGWNEFMGKRQGHDVTARAMFRRDDLLKISKAELRSMEAVWEEFGEMTAWELSDWMHKNCCEWKKPSEGKSALIPNEQVLKHLGVSNPEKHAEMIEEDRAIDAAFASRP